MYTIVIVNTWKAIKIRIQFSVQSIAAENAFQCSNIVDGAIYEKE